MGAAVVPVILATTAVAAGLQVAGQVQEGHAAKNQAKYQAAVSRNNQIIAEQKAVDAEYRGKVSEQEQRLLTQQRIGAARASAAGRGVLVDQGSALRETQDIAQVGELDALTIRSNAAREARGFRTQGLDYASEADLFRLQGDSAQRQANLGATSTLISSGTNVASRWYNWKYTGRL